MSSLFLASGKMRVSMFGPCKTMPEIGAGVGSGVENESELTCVIVVNDRDEKLRHCGKL